MKKRTLSLLVFIAVLLTIANSSFAQSIKDANLLYEEGKYYRAIDEYKKILDKDSDNAEATEKLADCYRFSNQAAKAVFWYKKANKYSKERPIIKLHYGQALMSNHQYKQAADAFEQYTKAAKEDARGWNFLEYAQNIEEYLKDSSKYKVSYLPDLNSQASEFSPVFYKDGIVFTSSRNKNATSENNYLDLYYARKKDNNDTKFEKPIKLEGKTETDYHEGPATFDKYGTTMFFVRNTTKNNKKTESTINLQIVEARLKNGKWEEIAPLWFNNENYSISNPTLSKDGNTLYFSSNMPGSFGGQDIYTSHRKGGKWQKPQNLGANVNTPGDESFPFIHEDGTLYYASNGLGGFGGFDIFAAVMPENETEWQVKNIGYGINTGADDFALILDTNKKIGYFSSNRDGLSKGDNIYLVSVDDREYNPLKKLLPAPTPALVVTQKSEPQNLSLPQNTPLSVPTPLTDFKAPEKLKAYTYNLDLFMEEGTQGNINLATIGNNNSGGNTTNANYALIGATVNNNPEIIEELDMSIVLIGTALDKKTRKPIDKALVVLENNTNSKKQDFTTPEDGNFYFKLEPNKKYTLLLIKNGDIEDSKVISTIGKKSSEIINAVLQGTPINLFPDYENPEVKVSEKWQQHKQDYKASNPALTPPPKTTPKSDQKFVFKIQVGAFKKPLQSQDSYLKSVQGQTEMETLNGVYRYVAGNFDEYALAENYKKELNAKGYLNAFVVAYLNDFRLEMPVEKVIENYFK